MLCSGVIGNELGNLDPCLINFQAAERMRGRSHILVEDTVSGRLLRLDAVLRTFSKSEVVRSQATHEGSICYEVWLACIYLSDRLVE